MLLLLVPLAGFCQEASLSVRPQDGLLVSSLKLTGVDPSRVLDTLEDGLRAEVVFQLRLYQKKRGLAGFLGDRLLAERRVVQVASYDLFTGQYVLERDDGPKRRYAASGSFLEDFFSLRGLAMQGLSGRGSGYMLGRIRLSPVRFIPPLNIISLFRDRVSLTTPWTEVPVQSGRR